MEKTYVTQTELVNQILTVGHGDLSIYTLAGLAAAKHEPDLLAHLVAWNAKKGEVRDTKVALPVLSLRSNGRMDADLFENAAAHLCLLAPKDLVRACRYHKELPSPTGGGVWFKQAVKRYIRHREAHTGLWDRTALQHRKSLKTLYALNHVRPSKRANDVLFKRQYPKNSIFQKVKELKDMPPLEAAGTILNNKIPFLIAVGALGGIKDKPDVVLALVENMSKAELINNSAALTKWGVMESPALKAAYTAGLKKKAQKISTLKAGQAAKAVKDKKIAKQLDAVQEEALDSGKGIDGDWLVLGDRSASMQSAIELARQVAAFLARKVNGKVHLTFFNTGPTYIDVTGKTLAEINEATKRFGASGGTSIGCGLDQLREKNIVVNGIAVCSDGGDNTTPRFHTAYQRYVSKMGIQPTVYLWHVPGDPNYMEDHCRSEGIPVTTFEMGYNVDYYSIPNIALTMRSQLYSLVDEIMETPLLTFDSVFKKKEKGGK